MSFAGVCVIVRVAVLWLLAVAEDADDGVTVDADAMLGVLVCVVTG